MDLLCAILFLPALVALCVLMSKLTGEVSERKARRKCWGKCGQFGWTNLREDNEVVNARCNVCGWISQYSKKSQHH